MRKAKNVTKSRTCYNSKQTKNSQQNISKEFFSSSPTPKENIYLQSREKYDTISVYTDDFENHRVYEILRKAKARGNSP